MSVDPFPSSLLVQLIESLERQTSGLKREWTRRLREYFTGRRHQTENKSIKGLVKRFTLHTNELLFAAFEVKTFDHSVFCSLLMDVDLWPSVSDLVSSSRSVAALGSAPSPRAPHQSAASITHHAPGSSPARIIVWNKRPRTCWIERFCKAQMCWISTFQNKKSVLYFKHL